MSRSSGDLTADRRADYAEMLSCAGDHAAAAELMLGALELAPGWALGWFRLGEMHAAAGAPDAAETAWRTVLALDPADRAGAALQLELIGRAPASSAPPSPFVEALFDHYAPTFDASLVERLGYRVPELLFGAIRAAGERRFKHALDLGCGTGLTGERLRPVCDRLEGNDISAAMLKKAQARQIYDRLGKADLQTLDLEPGVFDLVAAADVFMYVGALDRVVAKVGRGLEAGGLFGFSVEAHDGPGDLVLRDSRRYAHSEAYLRRLLAASGLSVVSLAREPIRMDRGASIEGLVVVARKG